MASLDPKAHVRPLPHVVDEVAATHPEKVWMSIPKSNDIREGYRDVTFERLAKAVNKMARWIERTIGTSKSRETLAYMGNNDTRYIITVLAALKTGYKILLTSTRNSTEGQRSLVKATDCKIFLYSTELEKQVSAIQDDQTSIKLCQIPSFEELLSQKFDDEHYEGVESDNPDDPAIIIHTSGSTGLPKPIPLRNGYLATVYRIEQTEMPNNRSTMAKKLFDERTIFCSLPWFHAMGLFMMLRSLYNQGPLVLPPSTVNPNADTILQMIREAKPQHGFFPPSILEDIVEIEGGMEALGTLEDIYFAGAPLSHDVGDRLSKLPNTRIQTVIGSTEAGIIDSFVNEDDADWDYFEWTPFAGAHMEPAGDGLCELVVKPLHNDLQGAFFSFPDISEWRTKDLYSPHPSKSGLWRYNGRNDDVIVLSNGEKFGPVDLEKTVEAHPAIHGALVVGQGRFQAGLLIEVDPKHAHEAKDPGAFIDQIWPTVEKGNTTVATHGRVFKSKIVIAKPDKSFARAPKGSIMRRRTNDLFAKEIDAIYHNESYADQLSKLDPSAEKGQITDTVRKALTLALPSIPKDLKDDDDLFSYGIDSLGVLGLTSALNHAMPDGENVIKPRNIYSNASVSGIVDAVSSILHGDKGSEQKPREQRMKDIVDKYTKSLPPRVNVPPRDTKHVVALTGSTGSLGTYLLNLLIADPNVTKVYCLNRSADSESRQKKAFAERSMTPDFDKVEFLQASFGKDSFGLETSKYKQLQDHVDVFIHNAWAVDFNMSLESFEDTHISGVWRCIDFSASSRYHPHVVFVSSIASVGNWLGSGHEGPVPENLLDDDNVALPQGYGESKHVSGRILAAAAEKTGIPATVVRVGQLAGPVTEQGVWNKQEWLPSIVASSKEIGKVPRNLGNMDTVDWVPVDASAQVLLDLCFNTQVDEKLDTKQLAFYHLVNPQTESWKVLAPVVQEHFKSKGVELEAVDFADWLGALKGLSVTKENAERVPGLKLIDFYEGLASDHGLPRLATDKTAAASETLRHLGAVDPGMMKKWLGQWEF